MRKGTLNACVLQGDRLNGDDDREEVKLNGWIVAEYKLYSATIQLLHTTSFLRILRSWWAIKRFSNY